VRTRDASSADAGESVLGSREMFERLQGELQFSKTRIEALNFEVARLKRWRFGSSRESLDATTQAELLDAIPSDTSARGQRGAPGDQACPADTGILGGLAARTGRAAVLPGVLRVTFWSAIAIAVTFGAGTQFHANVG
jgi:transposase